MNWAGGVRPKTQNGKDADPIGEAEPTKTALTRARRRAWKQIADIIPGYAEIVRPLEATAKIASELLPVSVIAPPQPQRAIAAGNPEDPYGLGAAAPAQAEPARSTVGKDLFGTPPSVSSGADALREG